MMAFVRKQAMALAEQTMQCDSLTDMADYLDGLKAGGDVVAIGSKATL